MADYKIAKQVPVTIADKAGVLNIGFGRKGMWMVVVLDDGRRFWLSEIKEGQGSSKELTDEQKSQLDKAI